MRRRRPVLLLPRLPPHGTPLTPGSKMAIRLACWLNGSITRPTMTGSNTIGTYWPPIAERDGSNLHRLFDVHCIASTYAPGVGAHAILTVSRVALRDLLPVLDGRVVVMAGRNVERIMFGRDRAPYGAVRMLNLNCRRLTPEVLEPVFCTTVLAPHPAPINRGIATSSSQARNLEFGVVWKSTLTLKHKPPRTIR